MSALVARSLPSGSFTARLPLPLRFAVRELRAGLGGFYVFIACVALGVMVITGVGALSDALRAGFEAQGRSILGGDATLARSHKRAEPAEREWIDARGAASETATMRAMARRTDGSEQALAELKGVDAAYPLVGAVTLDGGRTLADTIRAGEGAIVDPILLERLRLKVGDRLAVGQIDMPILGTIKKEPDTITDRLTFGPRVLVSLATMEKTGLVQPGSLVRWRYALALPDGAAASPAGLVSLRETAKQALPDSGFIVADRRDPSPQITRTLERLRQFLTLIGLTSLLVGGVGVANAVATFIDRRRKTIATFKCVGASSATVLSVFLAQVLLIASIGVVIGLVLGAAVPAVITWLVGDALPIKTEFVIRPWSVISAAIYGLLVALVFTLWPLGRTEQIRAGALFREEVAPERTRPRALIIAATIGAALVLMALAVWSSDSRRIALYFCLGLVVVFALFLALGQLVTVLARRTPRARKPELALAVGNLGAPGGLTRSVVLSLGAGLSLLVAVALVDASIMDELTTRTPQNSPNYFVLDLKKSERDDFARIVKTQAPEAEVSDAPMLRGRLMALKGVPAERIKAAPEAQWVLTGERGLSYSDEVPTGSKVVAGSWWDKDYDGPPLVSFEVDLARRLGVKLGDSVTVNVLGRTVEARIASLREVKWESLAINFVMVFSPNTLRAAPHNLLATVTLPASASLAAEAELARVIGRAFPAATTIRVKDAINSFQAVFSKIMAAVRVAGGVTLLAGALVLAGALATAQRRRIKQAVILKTLGATRWRILTAHAIEYGLISAVTALFAVVLGALAAWVTLTSVMDIPFVFDFSAVLQALVVALGLVMLFGGIGTWQVLKAKPVSYLRSE